LHGDSFFAIYKGSTYIDKYRGLSNICPGLFLIGVELIEEPSKEEVQKISDKLTSVLAQDDEFWPRWTYFAEQRGVTL
jgi:hypothetical protein